jgi:hypothetical protein
MNLYGSLYENFSKVDLVGYLFSENQSGLTLVLNTFPHILGFISSVAGKLMMPCAKKLIDIVFFLIS